MKKYILSGLLCVFTVFLFAQETDSTKKSDDKAGYKVSENEDVQIIIDEIVKKATPDSTILKLGDKEIEIIEENGETSIKFKDLKKNESEETDEDQGDTEEFSETPEIPEIPEIPNVEDNDDGDKDSKFKGHWAGFSFGPNNYVDKDNSLARTPETEFLDLNTGKSWNFNFNFAQYSFPIVKDKFGLVTGMGIEWSNYHFQNNNSIMKYNGRIVDSTLNVDLIKNRFQTTFLTVPLLVEVQLFDKDRKDRLYLSTGVIAGLKLFSNTKIKYYEDGSKQKSKEKGDYYLNPLRYGLTARVGYKMVELYANYYLTPLFIEKRGPELYPVAAGLVFSF
jgi:hypothetical protein